MYIYIHYIYTHTHIYIYIYIYISNTQNNSYKNLFLIFLFNNTLTAKLDGNDLTIKKGHFFPIRKFFRQKYFQFPLLQQNPCFVTTQYATTIFYQFYLNP